MAVSKKTYWRKPSPHTIAKHKILKQYLQVWFPILGRNENRRIVYIDGFCGKGRYENNEIGSPLIALETAINCPIKLGANISFRFVDDDNEMTESLQGEIDKIRIPTNFDPKVILGSFEDKMELFLSYYESKNRKVPPTFVFIDPFGIKGVPFTIIERLMKHPRCEVLINFMVSALNRSLGSRDPNTKEHALKFLGLTNGVEIPKVRGKRKDDLRIAYGDRLRSVAEYVRHFEMRNIKHRTIYYLFFATNHPLGHYKMKEAMWKVDPGGDFVFSDATDQTQITMFKSECIVPSMAESLQKKYTGKGIVTCLEISPYVYNRTPFLKEHLITTLKYLEGSDKIDVLPSKIDGKKRKAGTFPPEVQLAFV